MEPVHKMLPILVIAVIVGLAAAILDAPEDPAETYGSKSSSLRFHALSH